MHWWNCGVPCCEVGSEVLPEVLGGEARRHDDRGLSGEGCEDSSDESVDVVEWHDEHGAVGIGEVICLDFVCHGFAECFVCEWNLELLV